MRCGATAPAFDLRHEGRPRSDADLEAAKLAMMTASLLEGEAEVLRSEGAAGLSSFGVCSLHRDYTAGVNRPIDPHMLRWMVFIDGENFAIRGRAVAEHHSLTLPDCDHHKRDVFLWLPFDAPRSRFLEIPNTTALRQNAIRAYYYTSLVGSHDDVDAVRTHLSNMGFSPEVFKRPRGATKAKGVDITLTRDMLVHAFKDNYDVAVLVAGDADYIPLVEEVKRNGKVVYLAFLVGGGAGLSQELVTVCDGLFDMTANFYQQWRRVIAGEGPAVTPRSVFIG
jgi:uncharacterized LabA/DUF88 family protein